MGDQWDWIAGHCRVCGSNMNEHDVKAWNSLCHKHRAHRICPTCKESVPPLEPCPTCHDAATDDDSKTIENLEPIIEPFFTGFAANRRMVASRLYFFMKRLITDVK